MKPDIVLQAELDSAMTPAEVAVVFGVTSKSIMRWTDEGKFGKENEGWFRTLGGHRRYKISAVEARKKKVDGTKSV